MNGLSELCGKCDSLYLHFFSSYIPLHTQNVVWNSEIVTHVAFPVCSPTFGKFLEIFQVSFRFCVDGIWASRRHKIGPAEKREFLRAHKTHKSLFTRAYIGYSCPLDHFFLQIFDDSDFNEMMLCLPP